jgi:hypothetical protein
MHDFLPFHNKLAKNIRGTAIAEIASLSVR